MIRSIRDNPVQLGKTDEKQSSMRETEWVVKKQNKTKEDYEEVKLGKTRYK